MALEDRIKVEIKLWIWNFEKCIRKSYNPIYKQLLRYMKTLTKFSGLPVGLLYCIWLKQYILQSKVVISLLGWITVLINKYLGGWCLSGCVYISSKSGT